MTRVLSFHSSYQCRDTGACCSAGWPIPVEADRAEALRTLDGRLPPGSFLLPVVNGHCVFHDATRRRCRAHEALGHAALPLACRQFPRVSVIDPRGVSVTLSHFCPTARAMLDNPGSCEIMTGASAFPAGGEYEGLDVRDALPPLLRPDMLMEWESWWLWEAESVALIAAGADEPASALATLAAAIDLLDAWTPDRGPLDDALRLALTRARERPSAWPLDDATRRRWRDGVLAAIPPPHRPRGLDRVATPPPPRVLGRFLAAHAFANWTAHQGNGLRAWLRSLEVAYALASDYGVRQADLLIRHLADPAVLAVKYSRSREVRMQS
jgi:Fe-S-cluster containining protein